MKKDRVIVIFGGESSQDISRYDEIISGERLKSFIDPGSIDEASSLLEELPKLKLNNGQEITKSLMYKGYELWWIHNNDIFRYFCLPYTQYKRLLEYLREFKYVDFLDPPNKSLFYCYLKANGCFVKFITGKSIKNLLNLFSVGILIQTIFTIISIPLLMIKRSRVLVYTGDKFEKGKDYDFRMKFVYGELRERKLPFVEFIRGIESWKTVLAHAWKRKRPVVYSEAITHISRFISVLINKILLKNNLFEEFLKKDNKRDPMDSFKLAIATQYVCNNEDIWATRIMHLILKIIGVKVAFIPAASERSWHTVLGCKLNNIPTIGIMHGVQFRNYNTYDFLVGFNGDKSLSVDKLGVWSQWWKDYYKKNSDAYSEDSLYISGPMRPLIRDENNTSSNNYSGDQIRVMFLSEEMAVPQEVLPYLYELLKHKDIKVFIKFRPNRDGFGVWLEKNHPEILRRNDLEVLRGSMQEAIDKIDIAVGCQSTGVIEALLKLKIPIYFKTSKWGDYYNLKDYDDKHSFFAENPEELIKKIKDAKSSVSRSQLEELLERYFGDPYKNGSKWVVDGIEKIVG